MVPRIRRGILPAAGLLVLGLCTGFSGAEEPSGPEDGRLFRFRHTAGDKYRIVSEVDQTVLVNGQFDRRARILNRIAVDVLSADGEGAELSVEYQTSEKGGAGEEVYQRASQETSRFYRAASGRYTMPRDALVPSIRHIPTFPEEPLQPGDAWTAPAEEVHYLEPTFGLDLTVRIPMKVHYRYAGPEKREGLDLHRIDVAYRIDYQPDLPGAGENLRPVLIQGIFQQRIWWNAEEGRPQFADEEYQLAYKLSSEDIFQFEGTSRGEVFPARDMERRQLAEDIQKSLDDSDLQGARAEARDEGVQITVEDLHFKPDTAILRSEAERNKLQEIADILKQHPDRDIRITGHAARVGSTEYLQELSEKRAAAVAGYFLEQGVREETEMVVQGRGARDPVASNETPEGRRKNRRVEIIILEN